MSNFNIKWIRENFSKDLTIFYIGAADLTGVINFRHYLPESNLFAFECSNYWIEKFPIREQAKHFNINYNQIALSDQIGKINFYPCVKYKENDWPVSSSIYEPTDSLNYLQFEKPITIESNTLENFCAQTNTYPDFIHIDVQGAEFAILSHLGKNLPKAIWAEICEFENYKTGVKYVNFKELMRSLGYELFYRDGPDELYKLKTFICSNYVSKQTLTTKKLKFVFNDCSSTIHGKDVTVFYNLCKSLAITDVPYKVNNLPDDTFIYEYQHNHDKSVSDFFGDLGFMEVDPCPENVLERIRNKKAYLLISIPFESPLQETNLNYIHTYFVKKNLPATQIIYQTCCLNGQELYENFCRKINDVPRLNFEYMAENFLMHYELSLKIQEDKNNTKLLNKDFLMFNRRWLSHPHRTLFLYNIFQRNIIDNFYISFTKTDVDHSISYTDAVETHFCNFYNKEIDNEILKTIEDRLPLLLDTNDLVSSNLMFEQFSDTKYFYDTSLVHVVSETYFYSNIIHLTEKTFKPMLYKQPFIMLGPPFMLKHLRELGFKTFNNIWDESYDQIVNHNERLEKILNLLEFIGNLSKEDKYNLYYNCTETVNHNFNLLRNFKYNKLTVSNFINKYKLL